MAIRHVSHLMNPLTAAGGLGRTPTKGGVLSICTFIAFALSALSAKALPVIIPIPPVQITSLGHNYSTSPSTEIEDRVDFPCGSGLGSCSSSGFSAAIANGDEIIMRFEAPSGERFHIFDDGALTHEYLFFGAGWSAGSDTFSVFSNAAVNFENLTGTAPTTQVDNRFVVGSAGAKVEGSFETEVTGLGDLTFTAVTFTFTVNNSPPGATASFGAVGAPSLFSTSPNFAVIGGNNLPQPDQVVMQLEPIPEPSTLLLLTAALVGLGAIRRTGLERTP